MIEIRHKYIVAVYLVDRRYGGPEEGGWWYDIGELIRIMRVFGADWLAVNYCRRLNDKLETSLNKGRRDIGSVLSTGRYAAEIHEIHRGNPPAYYPERKPHYE